jgi:hypothetical protein
MKMFDKGKYKFSLGNIKILEKLELFSHAIFNYLNGKVNVINRNSYLEINYEIFSATVYGGCNYPNEIILYLNNLLYHYRDDIQYVAFYKMSIIYILTHELFHCDQIVDDYLYKHNDIYHNKIEAEVNSMTVKFLLEYKIEMINLFDISDEFTLLDFVSTFYSFSKKDFVKYNRYDLFSYYTHTITRILDDTSYSISNILYHTENIMIVINGISFLIQYNHNLNPNIEEFNRLIYPFFPLASKTYITYYYTTNSTTSDNGILFTITINYINNLTSPISFIEKEK